MSLLLLFGGFPELKVFSVTHFLAPAPSQTLSLLTVRGLLPVSSEQGSPEEPETVQSPGTQLPEGAMCLGVMHCCHHLESVFFK